MAKRTNNPSAKITHAEVRMYRMGTGDCFVIKFFAGSKEKFKMMIDAGACNGKTEKLIPYVEDLKEYVNNHVNLLVITHEHTDHVLAFQRCKPLFINDFKVDHIWMGWTENDNDRTGKVQEWKEEHGQQKKALAFAAKKLNELVKSKDYAKEFKESKQGEEMLKARTAFSLGVNEFADLHVNMEMDFAMYTGGLVGMDIVKEEIATDNIRYLNPGEVVENLEDAEGIKFYILGPPQLYEQVKKETGGAGETYEHNNALQESNAFAAAIMNEADDRFSDSLVPFDTKYVLNDTNTTPIDIKTAYDKHDWRKINYDWLFSAGSLALRMNSLTNNLSLVIAIEFEESGRVMLFPGDAEYGSWASWHDIDWDNVDHDGDNHFTEDLLNRTVFYKVAHHLSHNGTARRLGLEMMKHKDLTAMATLDYDVIGSGWTNTMPNAGIIKDLLTRSKGRLMIMNDKGLEFDNMTMTDKIEEARTRMTSKERSIFKDSFIKNPLYLQYTVKG